MYQLYTLQLNFTAQDDPFYVEKYDRMYYPHEQYQDDITYACCIELAARGIYCTQSKHNRITFENSRDYTYATLYLSGSAEYTVRTVKNPV